MTHPVHHSITDATLRKAFEAEEDRRLSPRACRASQSRGRAVPEQECFIRTCFQRDMDRILHSEAFRRLKHKTQVFLSPTNDHFRTRLTHTLEVVGIARSIARCLRLNEDLTEAIALGHDLGHTPFGHAGEEVLAEIAEEGFHHAQHSVRVVTCLEKGGKGLNLTAEVLDGIARHSKGRKGAATGGPDAPATLEGQVVRLADLVAYINHDIDDAIRAGVIALADLPAGPVRLLGERHSQRIHHMVMDIVTASAEAPGIVMSPPVQEATEELRDFLYGQVYPRAEGDGATGKAKALLRQLARWFLDHPDDLLARLHHPPPAGQSLRRTLVDYLASMTDEYAIRVFKELFVPHFAPELPGTCGRSQERSA
ncbi:MAG: Deoxyguanosinetriphosphate triphosphohydrolase [Candidatus Ozemobacter sibiricus]|uniref:Deoxyguanosinetriphosphate triphosphohydrolase n=1 Tax=Candidatus Ozemobacter sibiricus TaxID=2268124 RepID=A0A367ZUV4_9BACT|nr:MAG: Deoxyguanosinetriphosphate triphosphohydrolase [Candidatus Ozemobacter sibiricus]